MQSRKFIWGLGAIVVLAALGVAVKFGHEYLDARIGLVGTAREAFIPAAVDHCKRNASDISPSNQTAFCKCYSERLADTLSNNDVQAIGTLDPRISLPMQPKLHAAARACADRFEKAGHL